MVTKMSNYDMTYCSYNDCPFKDCDRHLMQTLKFLELKNGVSIADFSGTCRRYITYLVKEVYRDKQRRTYLY